MGQIWAPPAERRATVNRAAKGAVAESRCQASAFARCRFAQVANVESEYQMGAIVTVRPVGRPITSTIGKPREVWPWAMKLLFGSAVFLSYWPLPLK